MGVAYTAVYKNESSAIRTFTPLVKVNQPEWEGKGMDWAKQAASADSVPRVLWVTMTLQVHGPSYKKSPQLKSFSALGAVALNPITHTCISMLIFKQGHYSPNREDQMQADVYTGDFAAYWDSSEDLHCVFQQLE